MTIEIKMCPVCTQIIEQDLDIVAADQEDPEVAQMVADGVLSLLRCPDCSSETGYYWRRRRLGSRHASLVLCVSPDCLANDAFIKEVALVKPFSEVDWVFSLEELVQQALLREGIRRLWYPDDCEDGLKSSNHESYSPSFRLPRFGFKGGG